MRDIADVMHDVMASAHTVRIVVETVLLSSIDDEGTRGFFAEHGLEPEDGVVRVDVLKGEQQVGTTYWGADFRDAVVALSQDYPPSLLEA